MRLAASSDDARRDDANLATEGANYRSLVDNLPLVIYSRTLEPDSGSSQSLYMSGQVEAVLDLPAHEATPGRVRDMIHPDDFGRVGPAYDEANRQAQPLSIDYRLITPLGRTVWVHDEARIVFDEDGKPLHAQGYLLDITAQRLAEIETSQALVEAERMRVEITRTLETMSDAFFSYDRDLRVIYVNESGAAMCGATQAEMIGRPIFDIVPGLAAGPVPAALNAALDGASGEYEMSTAQTTVEFRVHPSPEGVWVFARDVTERRRLEESLRQSQKLEAVGQLTGGIAHDFNNIVTAIMGYSEFALRDLSEGREPARIQSEIEAIQTAGERARELTRQLLAFSRQQVMQLRVLDLGEVVTKAERLLERLIGDNISITTSSAPDLAVVKCDETQIEQVLMNLAVNARDAMPDGGTLRIETANVQLTADEAEPLGLPEGAYVTLSVADSGHGIPDAIRSQIFEPFFTTKEVGKGTGLGLATVHGIVHQSKGGIEVESGPSGTTVRSYFPVSSRGARSRARPAARPSIGRDGACPARRGRAGAAEDDQRDAEQAGLRGDLGARSRSGARARRVGAVRRGGDGRRDAEDERRRAGRPLRGAVPEDEIRVRVGLHARGDRRAQARPDRALPRQAVHVRRARRRRARRARRAVTTPASSPFSRANGNNGESGRRGERLERHRVGVVARQRAGHVPALREQPADAAVPVDGRAAGVPDLRCGRRARGVVSRVGSSRNRG